MRNITHEETYNGFTLSHTMHNSQGFYLEILQDIEELMGHMTQKHGKVFFAMFGLKYPANTAAQYPDDNTLMSRFIGALKLHYKRLPCDAKCLWVRESSLATGQFHYHILILLDGNRTQSAHGLLSYATEEWRRCLEIVDASGLVHLNRSGCNDDPYGGVMIIRDTPDFQQVYGRCFERASYLAKAYSKGISPAHVNGFGRSQLH